MDTKVGPATQLAQPFLDLQEHELDKPMFHTVVTPFGKEPPDMAAVASRTEAERAVGAAASARKAMAPASTTPVVRDGPPAPPPEPKKLPPTITERTKAEMAAGAARTAEKIIEAQRVKNLAASLLAGRLTENAPADNSDLDYHEGR